MPHDSTTSVTPSMVTPVPSRRRCPADYMKNRRTSPPRGALTRHCRVARSTLECPPRCHEHAHGSGVTTA